MRKSGWSMFRLFVGIIIVVACARWSVDDSLAQSYPAGPLRIVVGFPPGGGSDATTRILALELSKQLGQSVIVENRPGAGGAMANERVAKAPADGYTLLMMTAAGAVQTALRGDKLPFDLERDLTPVSLVTIGAFVFVVHPSVPARNVKELMALAKARPGKLNFSSDGIGTSLHLAGELFNFMAGVKITHVPYKGGAEATIAAASGAVDMSVTSVTAGLPLVNSGRVRALAVSSTRRATLMPAIPTIDESGFPGYEAGGWFGVVAPAGVSRNIIAQVNAAISAAVKVPEVKEALNKQGLEPKPNTPEQFAAFIRKEIEQNIKLIKLANISGD